MTRKIAAANMECYLKKATLLQTNAKSDKNPSEQKVSGVAAVKSLSDMFDAKKVSS